MDIPLLITAFIILSPERHIVVTLNKTASVQNREKKTFSKKPVCFSAGFLVPMESKDSSGKNKALKIFSNEYDSCMEHKAGERSAF